MSEKVSLEGKLSNIPLDQIIIDPTQPRKCFDEEALIELAESIKEHGLLQPILVRPNGDGTFQIVHGERRYRAHQIGKLPTIRCIVSELSDSEVADARLAENIEREDLTDLELAREFQRRVDAGQTHQQIADTIKKARAYVTQRLALLKLPRRQQTQLEKGEITFTTARLMASDNLKTREKVGYAVTLEDLDVYKLIQEKKEPTLDELYRALKHDLKRIERWRVKEAIKEW